MAEEEEEEVINDAAIITAACLCQVLRHTRQITSPFSVSNVTNETKLVLRVQLKGNTALKMFSPAKTEKGEEEDR